MKKQILFIVLLSFVTLTTQAAQRQSSAEMQFEKPGCLAPAWLYADMITTTSAKVHWNYVAGAAQYQVWYRAYAAGVVMPWQKKNTTSTFKTLTGLTPGTYYQYQVRAVCADGTLSPFSPIFGFTTLMRQGTADGGPGISIFPSPNTGDFTISLDAFTGNTSIEVFDLSGRLILKEEIQIDTQKFDLPVSLESFTGIAMIRVSDASHSVIERVLVQ